MQTKESRQRSSHRIGSRSKIRATANWKDDRNCSSGRDSYQFINHCGSECGRYLRSRPRSCDSLKSFREELCRDFAIAVLAPPFDGNTIVDSDMVVAHRADRRSRQNVARCFRQSCNAVQESFKASADSITAAVNAARNLGLG